MSRLSMAAVPDANWFCEGKYNTTHNPASAAGCELLFEWWAGMAVVTLLNVVLTVLAVLYIKAPKGHENYGLAMKLLGVPFVWNCGGGRCCRRCTSSASSSGTPG